MNGSTRDDTREIARRYLICFITETETRSFSDEIISKDTQEMVVWETEWKTDLLKHERLMKYVIEMEG